MCFPHRRRDCRVCHHTGRNGIIDTPIFDQLQREFVIAHNIAHVGRGSAEYQTWNGNGYFYRDTFPFRYGKPAELDPGSFYMVGGCFEPWHFEAGGRVYHDAQPVPGEADYTG